MDGDQTLCIDLTVLTDRQREIVEMHYYCSLSFGQIALLTGSNYEAVKKLHKRAIRRLREAASPLRTIR